MIEGLLMLTAGGVLSVAGPVQRQLAWLKWSAALREANPIAPPSAELDNLLEQAGAALDRLS